MTRQRPSDEEPIARAEFELSDDKILDRDRTLWRMVWVMLGGIALVVAATAAAIFSGHAALVTSMWGQIVTAAFVGPLFVYAFVTIIKCSIGPTEAGSPRLVHRQMDSQHRVWRGSMLLNVFVIFFVAMGLPRVLPFLRATHQPTLLAGAVLAGSMLMYAFIMLLLTFILSAGPGLRMGARERFNDEFDSALRTRMMRFGYILVMLLLGAVFVVALRRPDWTLTALAWALYAGFAIPALYYLIADWRASRGGES
jgi:hypothetical protein